MTPLPPSSPPTTTLVHLTIPPTISLTLSGPFLSLLNTLSRRTLRTSWGRHFQDPKVCFVLSEWPSTSDIDDFCKSAKSTQHDSFEQLGVEMQWMWRINLEKFWQLIDPEGRRAELIFSYFPANVSADTCRSVDELRGIHAECGFIAGRTSPKLLYQSSGWVEGLIVWNGEDRRVYVVIREWENEEMEREHKAEERDWEGEGRPLWVDVFEKGLKDLGMTGWENVHAVFQRCHEALPYETVAARKKRLGARWWIRDG